MARARNIKPGFFRDADLLSLPVYARMLFVGLWTVCDRAGRMEDKPVQIKIDIFPVDPVDVDDLLNQLAKIEVIDRYEVAGKRYLQVVNFTKHQNPHRDEKPSTVPEHIKHDANTVQEPYKQDAAIVAIGLNPESLLLNPESRILIPEPNTISGTLPAVGAPPEQPVKKARSKKPKPLAQENPNCRTWEAYRLAYHAKYSTDPVRNAKVNGQIAQVVNRIGADEAPEVAGFFLSHRNALYVNAMHPVDLLLRDCEKLRTEWATGRQAVVNIETFKERDQQAKREQMARDFPNLVKPMEIQNGDAVALGG